MASLFVFSAAALASRRPIGRTQKGQARNCEIKLLSLAGSAGPPFFAWPSSLPAGRSRRQISAASGRPSAAGSLTIKISTGSQREVISVPFLPPFSLDPNCFIIPTARSAVRVYVPAMGLKSNAGPASRLNEQCHGPSLLLSPMLFVYIRGYRMNRKEGRNWLVKWPRPTSQHFLLFCLWLFPLLLLLLSRCHLFLPSFRFGSNFTPDPPIIAPAAGYIFKGLPRLGIRLVRTRTFVL